VLTIGKRIAGYRIEGVLGQGGMGTVYEATQLSLKRTVALKVISREISVDEDFRARFRREGELQAKLDHPNIVTIYEAGDLPDGMFIAMRLVRGPTMKELIRGGEMTAERALRLLKPTADALDAAHGAGLIHRDVKPQNILVGARDYPFLADFGLTKSEEDLHLTRTGEFVGTIHYVPPEQILGSATLAASDIYSLTAVLFESLTGSVPYPKPSDVAVLYSHVHEVPPSVTAHRPDLPPGIDDVIARGMAKEPSDRPASALALVKAAEEALGETRQVRRPISPAPTIVTRRPEEIGTPVSSATPSTIPLTRFRGGVRWRRRAVAVVGGAAVILAGAVAFIVGGSGETEQPTRPLDVARSSAALSVRAPAGWIGRDRNDGPDVPGLRLTQSLAMVPPSPSAAGAIAGLSKGVGETLLPLALRKRVRGELPRPDAVRLGHLEALRYRDVRVRGFDRNLDLFAVPASTGVATVACYAPQLELNGFRDDCGRVAQSVRLLRGHAFPLAADPATAVALDRVLGDLAESRTTNRRLLANASTPRRQAKFASALSATYSSASSRLKAIVESPALTPTIDAIVAETLSARDAYQLLAKAARDNDRKTYRDAADATVRAEGRVSRRIQALAGAGYQVRTG
jgi:serine/threonine protein kinase